MASIDLGEQYDAPASTGPYYGPDDDRRVPGPYPGTEVIADPTGPRPPTGGSGYGSAFPESAVNRPYSTGGGQAVSPLYRQTGGTTTTTPVAPGIDRPELAATPAVDEARIRRLTQTRSAAGQRALRSALREQILSASYRDNPNVAAMISRKALEGFGQGIAETYSRAQAQATSEEYRDRQTKIARDQAVFNAAMADYMKRFGTEQTTTSTYENVRGGAGGAPRTPYVGGRLVRGSSGSAIIDAERGF
jgi:hypothetical protein